MDPLNQLPKVWVKRRLAPTDHHHRLRSQVGGLFNYVRQDAVWQFVQQ